jgi:hypothetical protein
VAPAEPHQRSRLLNAIASPNVFVRSAVMASCAVPGVFPPVTLMARNVHGEAQPYLPDRRWVDGSIADDLPAKRLSRLYSTNHYIVSMVNPGRHAVPQRRPERSPVLPCRRVLWALGVGREMLNFYRGIAQRRGDRWPRFNMLLNGVHALMDQEYSGDINIIPSFRWYNPAKILSHLSEQELMQLMEGGSIQPTPTWSLFAPAPRSHGPWRRSCTASSTVTCARGRQVPSSASLAPAPAADTGRSRGDARDRLPAARQGAGSGRRTVAQSVSKAVSKAADETGGQIGNIQQQKNQGEGQNQSQGKSRRRGTHSRQ